MAIRTAAAGRCAPLSGPDFRAVGCGSGEAASFCGGVAEFREWAQRRNIFAMPSGAIFLNFCRVVGLCYCHEKRTLPLRPPQVHSLPPTAFEQENQAQPVPPGWLQVQGLPSAQDSGLSPRLRRCAESRSSYRPSRNPFYAGAETAERSPLP